ncbi:AraC family transcriptional regulator [Bacteroides acidifaciens]|uniref:AraC family transcriptional regulator n=1 Tax=Bacteroides acidifaciens TaxID=85831 RepID=UPI00267596F6|nr:helix-turn-helix transcriptional regulator [Bacteroides acidifaciens]
MKESIPMHLHRDITEAGIYQKIVTSENLVPHPIEYVHRDDYFILGLIVRGTVCIDIDFERQTISEGEIGLIRPGQVHRFVGGDDFEGWMFMIESGVVSDRYKLIFEKTSLSGNTLWLPNKEINELKTLYHLIYNLGEREEDMFIMRNLASAFVGIVAGYFKRVNSRQNSYNSRHAEIVLQLNSLLQTDITESHSPSYYADKLNLSPVYLNEVVKIVTGWSVSNYIRNEVILRAKRLLYHTNLTVKEIASSLGFEDNAYFTRLFTKATGKSPLQFRVKP